MHGLLCEGLRISRTRHQYVTLLSTLVLDGRPCTVRAAMKMRKINLDVWPLRRAFKSPR